MKLNGTNCVTLVQTHERLLYRLKVVAHDFPFQVVYTIYHTRGGFKRASQAYSFIVVCQKTPALFPPLRCLFLIVDGFPPQFVLEHGVYFSVVYNGYRLARIDGISRYSLMTRYARVVILAETKTIQLSFLKRKGKNATQSRNAVAKLN